MTRYRFFSAASIMAVLPCCVEAGCVYTWTCLSDAAARVCVVHGVGTAIVVCVEAHQVSGLSVRAHLQETPDTCDVAVTGQSEQRRVPGRVPPAWETRPVRAGGQNGRSPLSRRVSLGNSSQRASVLWPALEPKAPFSDMASHCSTHDPWPMRMKTPLLSARVAASMRAVERGSESLNSPEDCISVPPVRFHDIVRSRQDEWRGVRRVQRRVSVSREGGKTSDEHEKSNSNVRLLSIT